ncbi:heme-binding protein 2 [Symphorus nematophorus]
MIYLSGLVGFLLVLTAEARVGNSSQLQFCSETKQCLLFDLVCQTDQYQVRRYDTVKWVSTKESSYFMEFAAMRAFRRLYNYITGTNADGKKIEMTAPVIVKMPEVVKNFWETNEYTMSFLLPSEYQKNPPKPTDEAVYIEEMKRMNVYVWSYGGWMTTMNDKKQAKSLAYALDFVDAKYKKDFHYAVGYNSPMTMFNRHNEVWYIAQGDPECSSSEEMGISPLS